MMLRNVSSTSQPARALSPIVLSARRVRRSKIMVSYRMMAKSKIY